MCMVNRPEMIFGELPWKTLTYILNPVFVYTIYTYRIEVFEMMGFHNFKVTTFFPTSLIQIALKSSLPFVF